VRLIKSPICGIKGIFCSWIAVSPLIIPNPSVIKRKQISSNSKSDL
jgi:hypothetical protein